MKRLKILKYGHSKMSIKDIKNKRFKEHQIRKSYGFINDVKDTPTFIENHLAKFKKRIGFTFPKENMILWSFYDLITFYHDLFSYVDLIHYNEGDDLSFLNEKIYIKKENVYGKNYILVWDMNNTKIHNQYEFYYTGDVITLRPKSIEKYLHLVFDAYYCSSSDYAFEEGTINDCDFYLLFVVATSLGQLSENSYNDLFKMLNFNP